MEALVIGVLLLLLLGGEGEGAEEEEIYQPPKPEPGPEPEESIFHPPSDGLKPDLQPPLPPKPADITPPGEEPEAPEQVPSLPEIIDPYPTPGMFYAVQSGDFPYRVSYRALRTAGFLAAKEYGNLSDSEANAFGKQVASRVANQLTYLDFIECNGWNDYLYGTYGYNPNASHRAPTGRAFRFLSHHPDQLERLADGFGALRNLVWGSPGDAAQGKRHGRVDPRYGHHETLWLPGIDLQTLWDSDGQTIKLGGHFAGEGLLQGPSKIFPPAWVLALGVKSVDGAEPRGTEFGCGDQTMEF